MVPIHLQPLPGSVSSATSRSSITSVSTPHLSENPPFRNPNTIIANPIEPESAPSLYAVSRLEIVNLIFKRTATWVLGGIGIMVAGIGFSQIVFLPRIRVCLIGDKCSLPFGVGVGNALTLVQTLMNYWLQAGMLIASIGSLKLCAYQAWFVLMREGNTIDNLDLHLGAIRGNILDSARLAFRKKGRWLSLCVLAHLGINTAVPLVVGLSSIREQGARTFTYPTTIQFPKSSYISAEDRAEAFADVSAWAVLNDTSHSLAYRGSLVVHDERNTSVNFQAGGPRIKGSLSCAGFNDYKIIVNGTTNQYLMYYGLKEYSTPPSVPLGVVAVGAGTAVARYLWISDTTWKIPNATSTRDGLFYMAICTHGVYFVEGPQAARGVQEIYPSLPITPGCPVNDPNTCVANAVSQTIISWWGGGETTKFLGVDCRGSVLGPMPNHAPPGRDSCVLTEELWSETVTSMLDGLVRTGHKGTNTTTQTLIVSGVAMNTRRWWFQALIPFLTLFLYGVVLVYTTVLSQGRDVLKELTLVEIIEAAQTEHVRRLLESGLLAEGMVRYERGAGFTFPISSHNSDDKHAEKLSH